MNITFIGMPGAGKSVVGKMVAQKLGMEFLDIDKVLEERHQKPLQHILNEAGDEKFIKLEEDAVLFYANALQNTVVSTGGSMVYSVAAMEHLKTISTVVFLDAPIEEIKARTRVDGRGIVGGAGKTLNEIYTERLPLYQKYADITVALSGIDTKANAERVLAVLPE